MFNEYCFYVRDFGAKGDGITDDTQAITECIIKAQESKSICVLPAGEYLVNETLLIGSNLSDKPVTVQGMGSAVIKAKVNIDIARTNTKGKVTIKDLCFRHEGQKGYCLYLDEGFGHGIYNCHFSNVKGNTDSMLIFNGSYTDIVNSSFGNAESSSYAINATTIPGKININSNIFDCRVHGPGKGLLVNSSENNRPEGIKVSRNMFLNTGDEQITVESILHIDISNNMLDQSRKTSVLLNPKMQGLCGVYILGNYISPAQDRENGIAVKVIENSLLALTINISNNMIAYSGYGIVAGSNTIHLNIFANAINDITHDGVVINNARGAIISTNTFWRCEKEVVSTYDRINEAPLIVNNQSGDLPV